MAVITFHILYTASNDNLNHTKLTYMVDQSLSISFRPFMNWLPLEYNIVYHCDMSENWLPDWMYASICTEYNNVIIHYVHCVNLTEQNAVVISVSLYNFPSINLSISGLPLIIYNLFNSVLTHELITFVGVCFCVYHISGSTCIHIYI
jgi:hypothetical protein